jgi:hypothetical protein
MTRSSYPDEYELERQHELNRRLEIAAEQEPACLHYRPRNRFLGPNRPGPRHRYFSRLTFRPVHVESVEQTEDATP